MVAKTKKTKTKVNQVHTVGRRKTSIARSTMQKGSGIIRINNNDLKDVISNTVLELKVLEPLILVDRVSSVDVQILVKGGGVNSQADAIRQAIARGLVELFGEELKKIFVEYDRSLIVTDTRFKETKKPNNSHARAKRQKSYR